MQLSVFRFQSQILGFESSENTLSTVIKFLILLRLNIHKLLQTIYWGFLKYPYERPNQKMTN